MMVSEFIDNRLDLKGSLSFYLFKDHNVYNEVLKFNIDFCRGFKLCAEESILIGLNNYNYSIRTQDSIYVKYS